MDLDVFRGRGGGLHFQFFSQGVSMKKLFRLAAWLPFAVAVMVLAGCGKKPPECADAAAVQSLRKFMNDAIVEGMRVQGVDATQDASGVLQKYLANWTFDLSNVTSQGYDEKGRTRSCHGKVSISVPDTKQTGYVDLDYEMQMLEDQKSGEFQLRVDRNFQRWAYGASEPATKYYRVHGVAGTWVGTSQCNATQAMRTTSEPLPSTEAAQGFTLVNATGAWLPDDAVAKTPVKVVIEDGQVTMTITKPDGSSVVRKTELQPSGGFEFSSEDDMASAVSLRGRVTNEGIRTSMPNHVSVAARVKSNATGNELDGRLVRYCELNLQKQQ
jgi:hypothetical protein